ncbi:MAG TPA: lipid-binding SYLF domain-containing protein [Gemmatimonadaceae bacterium]|nr:lipid-binding SYLF domain-containing protein [Gemmatimonadaceae bacterium]
MNSSLFGRAALLTTIAASSLVVSAARAQDRDDEKLGKRAERAAQVLSELVSIPDKSPPKELLEAATCIAVVPGVVQAGLGVGGRFGFGVASCRTAGGWSAPVFVGLKGGSFGFQIGGQSADVVLVFVNKNAQRLASSTFDIGAGASVAAGPLGRNLSAETDYKAKAEIYSYSKTKGLFAGISLSGTKWESDYSANKNEYDTTPNLPNGSNSKKVAELLATRGSAAPADLRVFVESLEKNVGNGNDQ